MLTEVLCYGYYYYPNLAGEETGIYRGNSYPRSLMSYVTESRYWPQVLLMPKPQSYLPTPRSPCLQPSVLPMRRATEQTGKDQVWCDRSCTPQSTRQLIGSTLLPTFSEEPHNMGTDVLLQSWPCSMAPGAHDPKARVSNWSEHKASQKKEPQSGQMPTSIQRSSAA